jgi:hypothetical protein
VSFCIDRSLPSLADESNRVSVGGRGPKWAVLRTGVRLVGDEARDHGLADRPDPAASAAVTGMPRHRNGDWALADRPQEGGVRGELFPLRHPAPSRWGWTGRTWAGKRVPSGRTASGGAIAPRSRGRYLVARSPIQLIGPVFRLVACHQERVGLRIETYPNVVRCGSNPLAGRRFEAVTSSFCGRGMRRFKSP